jgi:GT2 family glycosyltransferase
MADITRNCSAVTGACLMTRRSCFEELGGFDTGLPVAFNDVDYCLRARKRGLLVVFTPLAELIHHESRTRGHSEDVVETPFFRARWRDEILAGDPYYNPNLTHFDPYCRLSTDEERDLWSHFRSMLEASSTS